MVTTIDARELSLKYGSQTILDRVSFSLGTGRITALIGPNGAGKSSAFRILAGLVRPGHGEVFVDGIMQKNFGVLRKSCGFLLESPDFYPYLTGRKNLEMLITLTGSSTQTGSDLLATVGLGEAANKKVRAYSRGMKQRLGLAQVMIGDPSFLILDEPFNGLDPDVREQMLALLVTLKEQGKGILVSTHQLEDIEHIADDFIMMHKGKIFLSGVMDSYRADKQNVTLFFSGPLPVGFDAGPGMTVTKNTIHGMADIKETEVLLKKLCSAGLIPYQVSRSGILYDKYMEMTR